MNTLKKAFENFNFAFKNKKAIFISSFFYMEF